jgi:hypothetical protein
MMGWYAYQYQPVQAVNKESDGFMNLNLDRKS